MDKTKSKEYSLDEKRKLASKISKIKNKAQLRRIKNIIFEENPNVSTTKSGGGVLMYFQNFTTKTYYRIEKFLKAIDKKRAQKLRESLRSTEANLSSEFNANGTETETNGVNDYSNVRNRLRLSNKEKRIMKKKEYERDMNLVDKEYDISTLRNTQTESEKKEIVKPKNSNKKQKKISKLDSSIFS